MTWQIEIWTILGGLGGLAAIILLLMECRYKWNRQWNRRILYTRHYDVLIVSFVIL